MVIKSAGPEILDRRFYPKGTSIIKQGDIGSCAYLVQSGRVKVYTVAEGREFELAVLEEGQIFGEMALVMDEPRSANVVALTDANIVIISRDKFLLKLESTDPTIRSVSEMLMMRLKKTNMAVMRKTDAIEEIVEICYLVYTNAFNAATDSQRVKLEDDVLPRLTDFMEAVRTFLQDKRDADRAERNGDGGDGLLDPSEPNVAGDSPVFSKKALNKDDDDDIWIE